MIHVAVLTHGRLLYKDGEGLPQGGRREVASGDRRNRGQGARPTNQYWGELI